MQRFVRGRHADGEREKQALMAASDAVPTQPVVESASFSDGENEERESTQK